MSKNDKLNQLVNTFKKIDGITNRQAENMAYSLLSMPNTERQQIAEVIAKLDTYVHRCPRCHAFFEGEQCPYCTNPQRDSRIILLLSDPKNIERFEKTNQYRGLYHLIADLVSANTDELTRLNEFQFLRHRIKEEGVTEVILGFDTTALGQISATMVTNELKDLPVRISGLGGGMPSGGRLEFQDSFTLEASLKNRQAIESEDKK